MVLNLNKILLVFFAVVIFTAPVRVFALPDDSQQALHIASDSLLVDYKTGVHTYEGNVKIDQGSTHLTADRLVTSSNKQHKLEEGIAYGLTKLAEYTTLPKAGDVLFQAKAKTIKFYPIKSMVYLEGDVVVTQGDNSFQGPIIIYNIKDQVVTAPASQVGRATIVIEPKKLKS